MHVVPWFVLRSGGLPAWTGPASLPRRPGQARRRHQAGGGGLHSLKGGPLTCYSLASLKKHSFLQRVRTSRDAITCMRKNNKEPHPTSRGTPFWPPRCTELRPKGSVQTAFDKASVNSGGLGDCLPLRYPSHPQPSSVLSTQKPTTDSRRTTDGRRRQRRTTDDGGWRRTGDDKPTDDGRQRQTTTYDDDGRRRADLEILA